jgi:hypothetical protein
MALDRCVSEVELLQGWLYKPSKSGHVNERVRLVSRGGIVYRICHSSTSSRHLKGRVSPERTSRPSASVLSISTDLPFMAYTLCERFEFVNEMAEEQAPTYLQACSHWVRASFRTEGLPR